MGEIQQQDVSSSSWVMRLRRVRELAQACGTLLGETFQRVCISAPPLSGCFCLHPCSFHSWELGCHGNSGVHLQEWDLSMEFVFCTPGCMQCVLLISLSQGSFFSPAGCHCFEVFSTSPFTERRAGEAVLPVSFPFYHCGPGI